MTSVQYVGHDRRPNSFGAFLVLATTWFVVQVLVALPFLVRIWGVWFRANGASWDRADAVAILLFLSLQSVLGAFLLSRSRRNTNFALNSAKGMAYGILSFLIAAPFAYLVFSFLCKPISTIPPRFFLDIVLFLGHRIPLLGVAVGGLLAGAVHWLVKVNEAQTERIE